MEGPSRPGFPTLSDGLGNIVQQGSPAQPQVIGLFTDIVEYFEGVIEVIFMCPPVTGFHSLQCYQFRKNKFQQTGTVQFDKSFGRYRSEQNLVQFISNTFFGYNRDTFLIAAQGFKGGIIYIEIQLGSKADTAHHAQRVVAKGNIRIERCADGFLFQVLDSAERVYQLAIARLIQTNSQCIDSKVTAVLIVLQRTVFHYRFAGIVGIRFLSCPYKLHLCTAVLQLCRTKVLKDGNVRTTSQTLAQCLGHRNATAYYHYINILGGTLQENIAYISANNITLQSQFICCLGYPLEYVVTKMLSQFFCCQLYHLSINHFEGAKIRILFLILLQKRR